MELVLLSGGSGKRLWPLSNNVRSKQFLKILKYNGKMESMVQRIYRQINETLNNVNITVSTSESQKGILQKQLGNDINVVCEPSRRNTYPAILLSAAYLYLEKNVDLNEVITILPIDAYVENDYFKNIELMNKIVKNSDTNICLMGIKPTYPSEKYGYILNNNKIEFKEKPNKELAIKYINNNALWNCGVFCTKLSYLVNLLKKEINFKNFEDIINNFDQIKKISFDYEVVEKEKKIRVIEYDGNWKDLGTWNTLTEEINQKIGNAIMDNCNNTNILNELNIPILSLGINDSVIVASHDGILVSKQENSSLINKYTEFFNDRVKYEERIWGRYIVLNETNNNLVKTLYIDKGKNISYQRHKYRDEVWTIVKGNGIFVLDDNEKNIKPNDVLYIPRMSKHSIKAIDDVEIVEVQLGEKFSEDDIERFEYNWKN